MKYLIAFILVSFLSPNIVFGCEKDREIIKTIFENELYKESEDEAYKKTKELLKIWIDKEQFKTLYVPSVDFSKNLLELLSSKNRDIIKLAIENDLYKDTNKNTLLKRQMMANPIETIIIRLLKKYGKFLFKEFLRALRDYYDSRHNPLFIMGTTEDIDAQKKQ